MDCVCVVCLLCFAVFMCVYVSVCVCVFAVFMCEKSTRETLRQSVARPPLCVRVCVWPRLCVVCVRSRLFVCLCGRDCVVRPLRCAVCRRPVSACCGRPSVCVCVCVLRPRSVLSRPCFCVLCCAFCVCLVHVRALRCVCHDCTHKKRNRNTIQRFSEIKTFSRKPKTQVSGTTRDVPHRRHTPQHTFLILSSTLHRWTLRSRHTRMT
jgi:hypothetical protein